MHAYTFSFVLLSKILSCESYHRSRKLDNQNGTLSGRTLQNVYFYPKWDSTTVIDFLDAHEVDAAIFSTVTEYDPQAIAILQQRLPYF